MSRIINRVRHRQRLAHFRQDRREQAEWRRCAVRSPEPAPRKGTGVAVAMVVAMVLSIVILWRASR